MKRKKKSKPKVVVTFRRAMGRPSGITVGAKELLCGDAVLFRFFPQARRNGIYVVSSIDGDGEPKR